MCKALERECEIPADGFFWFRLCCAGYLGYPFQKVRRRWHYQILYRSIFPLGRWR